MSAAEKLEALGQKYESLSTALPAPGDDFAINYLGPLANLAGDFGRALPQIIAVVEAAEIVQHNAGDDAVAWERFVSALAALDEALGDVT